MEKKFLTLTIAIIFILTLVTSACAKNIRGDDKRDNKYSEKKIGSFGNKKGEWRNNDKSGHDVTVVVKNERYSYFPRYHYHSGRLYRPGWFLGFSIVTPPIGAIVTVLPDDYNIIAHNGVIYYCYDNVYYTNCPSGYIVVSQPQIKTVVVQEKTINTSTINVQNPKISVKQPQTLSGDTVIINVPNTSDGYTSVILTKYNNGYIGPQKEFYPGCPTVEQLTALYGK